MAIKKLLPLLVLFLVIFFETKSSDGTGKNGESISERISARMRKNQQEWEEKKTPLTLAAAQGRVAEIILLLESRADINEKDGEGETALTTAAARPGIDKQSIKRNENTIRCLVEARADVNAVNSKGKNALMLSLNLEGDGLNDYAFKLLIESNTDVWVQDSEGKTVLDHAAHKWLSGERAVELLADAHVGDSQEEKERWAGLIEDARRISREIREEWLPNKRSDKCWGGVMLE